MSVPSPPKALDGHCAVVNNEQLYVLSSNAFQSIPLKQGAQWSQEATGKEVTGAACTKVVPHGDQSQAAMYVIGGTNSDSSYSGLQRYFFGNKTWETLSPPVEVMRNRLNHSATYIPDSNKILVYAGSPADQPTWLSSQTFTILAEPPYIIDSYTANGHTANVPILDTWNSSHAMMTGGSIIDSSVYLFEPVNGWAQYPISLVKPPGGAKGLLINGNDNSKILQIYDLTPSDMSEITSVVLQDANGQPAKTGQILGSSSSKRDLSVSGFPSYNATNAPARTSMDYAVARDDQGLVALSGASSSNPLYLFNQSTNGWVDSSKFFNGDQIPLQTSSASASATSTPTATSASTAAASSATSSSASVAQSSIDDASSRQHSILITEIGIIIGVCGGFALIFILVLLYLRWKKKQRAEHNGPLDGNGEGGRMSFADRGASFMREAEGSKTHPFFPTADRYSLSATPMPQITPRMSGRFGKKSYPGQQRRSYGHQQTGSFESTKELVEKDELEMLPVNKKATSPIIRKPAPIYHPEKIVVNGPVGLSPTDDEKERRKRSSGWSRYFATSQPTDMTHLPSAYRKPQESAASLFVNNKDSAYNSVYSEPPLPVVPAHIPATNLMPPLNIDFTKTIDGQRLSKVASSNPSISHSQEDFAKRGSMTEPMRGRIESVENRQSNGDTISSYNDRATMSSNAASEYYANGESNNAWTPMTANTTFKDHVNNAATPGADSRPTSSLYTNSIYGDRPYSRGRNQGTSFFPGAGNSKQSTKTKSTYSGPSADWASGIHDRDTKMSGVSAMTVFPEPSGESYSATARNPSQKSTKSSKSVKDGSGMAGIATANDRTSNMTLFPKAVSIQQFPGVPNMTNINTRKEPNTDVSWVNINGDAR